MNRILSWKLSGGNYAYIYLPESYGKTHITKRISPDDPIWGDIVKEVKGWDFTDYEDAFGDLTKEVSERYGITIHGNASTYWNFTDNNVYDDTNIVLLSGEGGGDGYEYESGYVDEAIKEFEEKIDKQLSEVRKDIENQNTAVKELVSQTVTQKDVHIQNLTELVEMLEAEGLRDKVILCCGGARISHELAKELGYDAGFGMNTYADNVASYIAEEVARRMGK